MSNSFLPKKAPNVFNQETLERALVLLRQPFSIAVIASIAAHGLLWAALPNLLADQQKDSGTRRRVQVVELSPAEKEQLPSLGINALPQTLLPIKPLPPAQSGTKLPDPKLDNDPLFSSTPFWEPPPPTFPLSGLPRSIFDIPVPATKPPQSKPSPKPTSSPNLPTGSKPTPTEQSSATPTGTPAATPAAPARQANLSPEQIAALQKDAERSRQLQSLYTFNGPKDNAERTEIGDKNSAKLYDAATKLSGGNPKTKHFGTPLGNVGTLFPQEACPFVKQETYSSIAAIVAPDGKLAALPSVLVPSGFQGLDNAAIEYVEKNYDKTDTKIATDGAYQLIRFNFFFNPKEACPSTPNPA